MTRDINLPSSWWGEFKINNEENKQFRIGPLTLIVRCMSGEWQIAHESTDDLDDTDITWEITDTNQLPESLKENSRYVFRKTAGLLTITPQLSDRSVISRPNTPFHLTAGEEVTLYVSSPLWLELAVGSSPKSILQEIAIKRPSDTWFGPSTLDGELCYASTTHCRLSFEELPLRPHRAITPVFIRNQAKTTLSLERLNVPAPFLPLYASPNEQLWTPKVTLIREKDGDMAAVKIDSKPPKEVSKAVLLSKPRKILSGGAFIRAFNAVFS